jgi:hypothetical protein
MVYGTARGGKPTNRKLARGGVYRRVRRRHRRDPRLRSRDVDHLLRPLRVPFTLPLPHLLLRISL